MEPDDRQRQQCAGMPYAMGSGFGTQPADRQRGARHGDKQRSDHIPPVPLHDPIHAIGEHADIMHRPHRQADDRPAEDRCEAGEFSRSQCEAGSDPCDCDQRGDDGQHPVECDRRIRLIAEHGDEMRRPGGGARGHGGQEAPVDPRDPFLGQSPAEQRCRNHRPGDAHQRIISMNPHATARVDCRPKAA